MPTTQQSAQFRTFNWQSPLEATWLRRHLCNGGVVLCAAEHMWGLSCDATNPDAVMRLLAIKQRPTNKGLILASSQRRHFALLEQSLNTTELQLVAQYWSDSNNTPTTLIFRDPERVFLPWVSQIITIDGKHIQTIAARLCHSGPLGRLSELIDTPLVTTSANISNHPAPAHLADAKNNLVNFATELPIVGDEPPCGPPSTIIDVISGKQLR